MPRNTIRSPRTGRATETAVHSHKGRGRGTSKTCRWTTCLIGAEKKYRKKTKAGYFWFMDFEDGKNFVPKAGDAYNVNNDPPKKCRECGKGNWVWTCDLV